MSNSSGHCTDKKKRHLENTLTTGYMSSLYCSTDLILSIQTESSQPKMEFYFKCFVIETICRKYVLLSQYLVNASCNFYHHLYVVPCLVEIIHLCVPVFLGLEGTNKDVVLHLSHFTSPKYSNNQDSKLLQTK